MRIYVSADPSAVPTGLLFPEIEGCNPCVPVHVSKLIPKVQQLIEEGKDFATCSEISCLVPGWMIRKGLLKPEDCQIRYIHPDGYISIIHHDTRGDFIEPWPEVPQRASIMDADFYLRYD